MRKPRPITIPSIDDPELAYETGVHLGDGCLQAYENTNDFRYTIWGSKDEFKYYKNTLKPLLEKLYALQNVRLKAVSTEYTIYLRVCSKQLVLFKHKILGLPIGKKNQLTNLPTFVKQDVNLLRQCLSGIADSDGSLTFLKKYKETHYYPRVTITICNKPLLIDINSQLRNLGFETTFNSRLRLDARTRRNYGHWEIHINGEKMLKKWVDEVGFRNPVQTTKYQVWEELGFCPPNTNLRQRLDILGK
jgi:hypothetical protein